MKRLPLSFVLFVFLFLNLNLSAQDSLVAQFLNEHTRTFDIEEGRLIGKGADFLTKEASKSQFLLIGEYHQSPRISQFTSSLIPVLDSLGFGDLLLEVGPHSAQILNEMRRSKETVSYQLKRFHTKYGYVEPDGYFTGAIPFFDFKEDADFLEKAFKKSWSIAGLDQEYYNGYGPLVDKMFQNLPSEIQLVLEDEKNKVIDSIYHYYWKEIYEDVNLYKVLIEAEWLHSFLDKAAINPINQSIRSAIQKTIQIYSRSIVYHDYVGNNQERVDYFKENIRNFMDTSSFDLSKGKLVVKMGSHHTSKGYNPMDMLDVGNFFSEVAELHGNRSLHISFHNRFVKEDGELIDMLEAQKDSPWNALAQMGHKDKWTIIDVRPMKGAVFYYPKKFEIPEKLKKRILQHDLILIPPTEYEGEDLYDKDRIRMMKPTLK